MVKILNKLLNDKNITTNKNNSNTLPNIYILYIVAGVYQYGYTIALSSFRQNEKTIQTYTNEYGWHKL